MWLDLWGGFFYCCIHSPPFIACHRQGVSSQLLAGLSPPIPSFPAPDHFTHFCQISLLQARLLPGTLWIKTLLWLPCGAQNNIQITWPGVQSPQDLPPPAFPTLLLSSPSTPPFVPVKLNCLYSLITYPPYLYLALLHCSFCIKYLFL